MNTNTIKSHIKRILKSCMNKQGFTTIRDAIITTNKAIMIDRTYQMVPGFVEIENFLILNQLNYKIRIFDKTIE